MLQSKTSTAVVVTFAPEKIDGWKLEDYIYIDVYIYIPFLGLKV